MQVTVTIRHINCRKEIIFIIVICYGFSVSFFSMFGIPISATAAMSGYNITIERITKIANGLEIFTNLPFEDRTSLLKENAGET